MISIGCLLIFVCAIINVSSAQLVKTVENCLGRELFSNIKSTGVDYEQWCESCFEPNGLLELALRLEREHPYAVRFLESNTEWAIEQFTRKGDYKTLVLIYGLLFDRTFLLSNKKNSLNLKQKLCYQMFVFYQNREHIPSLKTWKDILESAIDWLA